MAEISVSPAWIAAEGSCGVEGSLNISSLPFNSKTKSVKVPPVSTPTRTDERRCADRRLPGVLEVIWIGVTLKGYV